MSYVPSAKTDLQDFYTSNMMSFSILLADEINKKCFKTNMTFEEYYMIYIKDKDIKSIITELSKHIEALSTARLSLISLHKQSLENCNYNNKFRSARYYNTIVEHNLDNLLLKSGYYTLRLQIYKKLADTYPDMRIRDYWLKDI